MNRKTFQAKVTDTTSNIFILFGQREMIAKFDGTPINKVTRNVLIKQLHHKLTVEFDTGPSDELMSVIANHLQYNNQLSQGNEKDIVKRILKTRWASQTLLKLKMSKFGMRLGMTHYTGLSRDYNIDGTERKDIILHDLILNELGPIVAASNRLLKVNDGNTNKFTISNHRDHGEGVSVDNLHLTVQAIGEDTVRVFMNPKYGAFSLNMVNVNSLKKRLVDILNMSKFLSADMTQSSNFFEVKFEKPSNAIKHIPATDGMVLIAVKIEVLENKRDSIREKINALEKDIETLEVLENEAIHDLDILAQASKIISN